MKPGIVLYWSENSHIGNDVRSAQNYLARIFHLDIRDIHIRHDMDAIYIDIPPSKLVNLFDHTGAPVVSDIIYRINKDSVQILYVQPRDVRVDIDRMIKSLQAHIVPHSVLAAKGGHYAIIYVFDRDSAENLIRMSARGSIPLRVRHYDNTKKRKRNDSDKELVKQQLSLVWEGMDKLISFNSQIDDKIPEESLQKIMVQLGDIRKNL